MKAYTLIFHKATAEITSEEWGWIHVASQNTSEYSVERNGATGHVLVYQIGSHKAKIKVEIKDVA